MPRLRLDRTAYRITIDGEGINRRSIRCPRDARIVIESATGYGDVVPVVRDSVSRVIQRVSASVSASTARAVRNPRELNDRERGTILAALSLFQSELTKQGTWRLSPEAHDFIVSQGGDPSAPTWEGLQALLDKLTAGGE